MKVKELIKLLEPYKEYYVVKSDLDHETDDNIYISASKKYTYFTGRVTLENEYCLVEPKNIKIVGDKHMANMFLFQFPSINEDVT